MALGIARPTHGQIVTDPTPTVSVTGVVTTLRKELSGYANYGPAGADVLYTGQTGTWNFNLAALGLTPGSFSHAVLRPILVIDDHYEPALSNYSLRVLVNGTEVISGSAPALGLVHGSPFGSLFGNWLEQSTSALAVIDPMVVTIQNTSSVAGSDWIAIDAMALDYYAIPEPTALPLVALAASIAITTRCRRRSGTRPKSTSRWEH